MNEYAEYFATDQASSSHQVPILLNHKGRASLTTVCNLLFGMEVLEELHRPRRIDSCIADPNGFVYQPHELVEVGVSKPANAFVTRAAIRDGHCGIPSVRLVRHVSLLFFSPAYVIVSLDRSSLLSVLLSNKAIALFLAPLLFSCLNLHFIVSHEMKPNGIFSLE